MKFLQMLFGWYIQWYVSMILIPLLRLLIYSPPLAYHTYTVLFYYTFNELIKQGRGCLY